MDPERVWDGRVRAHPAGNGDTQSGAAVAALRKKYPCLEAGLKEKQVKRSRVFCFRAGGSVEPGRPAASMSTGPVLSPDRIAAVAITLNNVTKPFTAQSRVTGRAVRTDALMALPPRCSVLMPDEITFRITGFAGLTDRASPGTGETLFWFGVRGVPRSRGDNVLQLAMQVS